MERLQKVIYLIEENPIVRSFDDVEKILKSIFSYRKIKTILTEYTETVLMQAHKMKGLDYQLK